MADHHDQGDRIDHVLGVGEGAANHGLYTERPEHAWRHGLPEDPLRRRAVLFDAQRLHAAGEAVVGGDRLEGVVRSRNDA